MLPLVVFVLGPTGSGKSALAIALASRWNGEIVNCDSVQLYRGMEIGAAKTPVAERAGIPHHLLDELAPNEVFSAGEYARRAAEVIAAIVQRGRLPIVAGGTGFYVRALTEGLAELPARDEVLRAELTLREARRPGFVHRLLRRVDTDSARRIHANDVQKAVRAVEITLRSGTPMTDRLRAVRQHSVLADYRFLKLGLIPERAALRERIHRRCEAMWRGGLREEVQALVREGHGRESKALESIGYRQMLDVLEGVLADEEALERMRIATRQYAKRQLTWFRRDQEIRWVERFGDDPAALAEAEAHLTSALTCMS